MRGHRSASLVRASPARLTQPREATRRPAPGGFRPIAPWRRGAGIACWRDASSARSLRREPVATATEQRAVFALVGLELSQGRPTTKLRELHRTQWRVRRPSCAVARASTQLDRRSLTKRPCEHDEHRGTNQRELGLSSVLRALGRLGSASGVLGAGSGGRT